MPKINRPTGLRRRRGRIVNFFARVILAAIFWDILVRNFGGRRIANRTMLQRYVNAARRFRALAVELGGVMIKLGQFFSSRVDILPKEIIDELASLQDEVPAEPFERIEWQLESELGRSIEAVFETFEAGPGG